MPTIHQVQKRWQTVPDTDFLLAYTLKRDRGFVFAYQDYSLSWREYARFLYYAHKRRRGWSLAHSVGRKEFYGHTFLVNRHTLVPRPETELLVEEALKTLRDLPVTHESLTLIDIGTGTGCIPISILKTDDTGHPITAFATDISRRALRLAKRNAHRQTSSITFLRGNLLEPFRNSQKTSGPIILTANLPYLTSEQFAAEASIWREPYHALVARDNGLFHYEKLLQQLQSYSFFSSRPLFFFFEIDPCQSSTLTERITAYFPAAHTRISKDLAGNDRLIVGELAG